MRFITSFLADRDPDREVECDSFAEKLLRLLINLVTARDKSVRTQCCQLVQVIFNGLTADELDSDMLDSMQDVMMSRLEDKVPAVRLQAVKALPRLSDPGDVSFTSITSQLQNRHRQARQCLPYSEPTVHILPCSYSC